ncbi:MAG: hypothetical protein MN733_18115 [Nitrososphaera sp.]|nr:hypothetical protein [Nitrososphaera sp.]
MMNNAKTVMGDNEQMNWFMLSKRGLYPLTHMELIGLLGWALLVALLMVIGGAMSAAWGFWGWLYVTVCSL